MLAEINLLPRKDTKNQAKLLVILIITIIVIIVTTLFALQFSSLKKEEVEAEQRRNMLQEQLEEKLNEQNQESDITSVGKLQTAVDFAEVTSQDMIPVLVELTEQLPERGYIQQYEQVDPKTINVTVQFDMNRDAAFYLARLKESKVFENVFLKEITAKSENSKDNNISTENTVDTKEMPRIDATYQLKVANNGYIQKNGGGDTNEDTTP